MLTASMPEEVCCRLVADGLGEVGYQCADPLSLRPASWRISPTPFPLSAEQARWFGELGQHLRRFSLAADELYMESAAGRLPGWVCQYLDRGKPEALVAFQRMRRLRRQLPMVIRPDVIPTPEGMMITELDSVPGGMGVTGRLAEIYEEAGFDILTGGCLIPEAFAAMICAVAGNPEPRLAIIVSEESKAYRPEMTWLARSLSRHGVEAFAVRPEELWYSEDGVFLRGTGDERVDVVYRFFELFDLSNIPKVELLMFLNKKRRVAVTPPLRPLFEEKMWLALLRHPVLAAYWRRTLGDETYSFLRSCFPPAWVLDPVDVPPHATIPDLNAKGSAVNSWRQLYDLGRGERHFVIKPSGFSELAWGSRGVIVGHDVSGDEWRAALNSALEAFPRTPHVIQEFRAGSRFECRFYDPADGLIRTTQCRVRLCPYYFIIGEEVKLASVLATLCPLDKKKIHGMPEAIMTPCSAARV
jgi:hypothetical protein